MLTDDEMARIQKNIDRRRAQRQQIEKAKATKERADARKKQRALGFKVIKGGKSS